MAANDLNPVSLKQLKQTYDKLKEAADSLASQVSSLQDQLGDLDTAVDGIIGLPSGGSNGQYLQRTASGYAWATVSSYTLPKATSSALGGVKIGYPESGKNYPVELNDSGQMFVNVPWANTTYTLASFGITATADELNYMDGVTSGVQAQLNGKAASSHTHANATTSKAGFLRQLNGSTSQYLRGDGTWATPSGYTLPEATSTTLGGVKVSDYDDACAFFFYG